MKIKFNNAGRPKKKDVIYYDGQKHLTLSNRQLSVQLLYPMEYELGWSIDRITLVGIIKQTRNPDGTIQDLSAIMDRLLDTGKSAIEKTPKGWLLKDRYDEQIAYVEYVEFDSTKGRIDFNPNKLSDIIQMSLKSFIDLIFDEVKFSRIDVACDIINVPDEYIEQYKIIKDVKTKTYRSRSGKLESIYFGSSSSGRQVRLYNKALERRKRKVVVSEEVKTWWRFEAQLRGETTEKWYKAVEELLDYFTSPHFIPLDIIGIEKVMLKAFLEHPECMNDLGSKSTKAKYKKLIKRIAENDELTKDMIEQFKSDMSMLREQLDEWLGYLDVTDTYNLDID